MKRTTLHLGDIDDDFASTVELLRRPYQPSRWTERASRLCERIAYVLGTLGLAYWFGRDVIGGLL